MELKHIFIVNPIAGQGKGLKVSKIIHQYCLEEKINYEVYYTSKPNEAQDIVRTLGENNIIYCVGGDGTLREVASGVVDTNNILSLIPAGSGNDFNKSLESLPKGIQKIDVGLVNKHYFINIASIGLDAEVANNVGIMKEKHIPNSMLYNASIIYSLFHRKDPIIDFYGYKEKITLMAICNGKYYGHGVKIAPDADMQDGMFDIYKVDSLKGYQIPPTFLKLISGTHGESSYVSRMWDDSIIVKSDTELNCNIDGDIIKGKEFSFRLLNKAISFDNSDELGLKRLIKKCKVQ